MKEKTNFLVTFTVAAILIFVSTVSAQQANKSQNPSNKLVNRFEKIIKIKEPKFSGGRTSVGGESGQDYAGLSWKYNVGVFRLRLYEEYVDVAVSDYYESESAMSAIKNYLTELRPAPAYIIRLMNLGDEAYIEFGRNSTDIRLRKSNVIMDISATNRALAERFARHFLEELDRRERGEP